MDKAKDAMGKGSDSSNQSGGGSQQASGMEGKVDNAANSGTFSSSKKLHAGLY